jgi:hypothetical protein
VAANLPPNFGKTTITLAFLQIRRENPSQRRSNPERSQLNNLQPQSSERQCVKKFGEFDRPSGKDSRLRGKYNRRSDRDSGG